MPVAHSRIYRHPIGSAAVLAAAALGCASGSVGVRESGLPACGVSSDGMMTRTVSVDRGQATYYGIFDRVVARLESGGLITKLGVLWNTTGGRCTGDRLVIDGVFSDTISDPIGDGQVALPGFFSPTVYRYTEDCSLCEAALGAYALYVLEQEAAEQQQQHRSTSAHR